GQSPVRVARGVPLGDGSDLRDDEHRRGHGSQAARRRRPAALRLRRSRPRGQHPRRCSRRGRQPALGVVRRCRLGATGADDDVLGDREQVLPGQGEHRHGDRPAADQDRRGRQGGPGAHADHQARLRPLHRSGAARVPALGGM
ncbi:MAG: hypothetical protein AVDCRST_MAG53-3355, partial [uncultured Solirubrobacteraceae bacterium]